MIPAADLVVRERDRAFVEALVPVDEGVDVDRPDPAQTLALGTHAAGDCDLSLLGLGLAALECDLPADGPGRDVEAERARRTDVWLAEPAEKDAEHVVGVGRGAHGRPGVGTHRLLVDADRRGEALQRVDVRSCLLGHEALHERGVGLVDEAPRLGCDRLEHEGALAGA